MILHLPKATSEPPILPACGTLKCNAEGCDVQIPKDWVRSGEKGSGGIREFATKTLSSCMNYWPHIFWYYGIDFNSKMSTPVKRQFRWFCDKHNKKEHWDECCERINRTGY